MSKEVPTYTEIWPLLNAGDRARLAEIDQAQTEILEQLANSFADEVDAPTMGQLQVERLHVYRAAQDRRGRHENQS
ncbi:hypothetical protein H1Q78_16450 [Cellulosimicrobium cellulans]|uniref:hypothetical protein n=1 Tax=Cellulosimicrobium cellulans TaxID=1710 RepID=UPI001EDBC89B|nr:hypothetical protein [Cellulosimicrobium cellulans]UKJ63246.1 hypothetical protein H1Q78_16450 [Cellulosimicrobium cellulans]